MLLPPSLPSYVCAWVWCTRHGTSPLRRRDDCCRTCTYCALGSTMELQLMTVREAVSSLDGSLKMNSATMQGSRISNGRTGWSSLQQQQLYSIYRTAVYKIHTPMHAPASLYIQSFMAWVTYTQQRVNVMIEIISQGSSPSR
jgi:hypothetical protein